MLLKANVKYNCSDLYLRFDKVQCDLSEYVSL